MACQNPWRRVLGLVAVAVCLARCGVDVEADSYTRELAQALTLGPSWTELEPHPPLLVQHPVGELVIHHSTGLTLTRAPAEARNTVFCPMLGEMIRFDVELVKSDGSVEALAAGGISPGRLGMRPGGERAPAFEVTRVRLRANLPLEVSKLEWRARADVPSSHGSPP